MVQVHLIQLQSNSGVDFSLPATECSKAIVSSNGVQARSGLTRHKHSCTHIQTLFQSGKLNAGETNKHHQKAKENLCGMFNK
jgi:hypothetical protein